MNTVLKTIVFIVSVLLLYSCEEAGRIDTIDDSPDIPAQITDLELTPVPGGAILTYKIPEDPILSSVKAVYEIQPNVFREAKASRYSDTLALVGYGDTLEHKVKVFSVGKNLKESAPVEATFQPLTPPVKSVFETLKLQAAFGGSNVSFQNESQANISMVLLVDSTGTGEWKTVMKFYTGAEKGNFSARGFAAKETKFAVYVNDRWNNKSDTLIEVFTPLFEEEIPKNTFEWMPLPGEGIHHPTFTPVYLYNGIVGRNDILATPDQETPHWFTFDFGQSVILSRMKLWHRPGYEYVEAIRYFEIWGTNDPPLDGSWDNWTLLGSFESFKPSGLPVGTATPEDRNYASGSGEDFDFEVGLPAVRYFRLKTIEGWMPGSGKVQHSEFSFWGQIN